MSSIDSMRTDHDLVRYCLSRARGYRYTTLNEMYRHFREILDGVGYSGGLTSGPNSISCVTQYYQPRDRRGQAVVRFNPELSETDDIIITANEDGYAVTHAGR